MFDATLQIGHMDVLPAEDHVVLTLHPVFLLPMGNGQAAPIPFGVFRVPVAKDAAAAHAEKILDVLEGVEGDVQTQQAKTDLVIAQNLNGIDKAVEQDKKLRGK